MDNIQMSFDIAVASSYLRKSGEAARRGITEEENLTLRKAFQVTGPVFKELRLRNLANQWFTTNLRAQIHRQTSGIFYW